MIKILSGVLFLTAGLLLGKACRDRYGEKVKLWENILSFLSFCESEILYSKKNFTDVLTLFRQTNSPFSSMIFDACLYNTVKAPLAGEGEEFIHTFCEEVSSLHSDALEEMFILKKQRAEEKLKQVKEEYEKKGKMYAKLIPLFSIGVYILFL